MNYILFDLEATCWRDYRAKQQSEIIEIGAVKIGDSGVIEEEFCLFVKPKLHPQLSDFCKRLTSIQQYQVDRAEGFAQVIHYFRKWIGEEYLLCSWGFYDKKQLQKDCSLHGLDTVWAEKHISVKHQYGKMKGIRQHPGLKQALKLENMEFQGTHHRGIDDARNVGRIFMKYFDQWDKK